MIGKGNGTYFFIEIPDLRLQFMSVSMFIFGVGIVAVIGVVAAPFPYWPTYRRLWWDVLRRPGRRSAKYHQALFLLKAGVLAPLWTLLWYLDELIYPQYRRRPINPVFIIGQPRCGTTLLHHTLAMDKETFFAVRHFEWRYPFITLQKLIRFFGLEKQVGRKNYWPSTEAGRLAAKMHPNTLSDWEEDGIFFEEIHLHHFFMYLRFPNPELLPWLDSFSELPTRVQQHMLTTHGKVIQKVQYLRGPEPRLYLSKEVTSHSKVPLLARMYPKARFVVIVRSSADFMSSLLALVRMSTKSKTGIDPTTIPGWEGAFMQRMREDSRRLVSLSRETIPADRQVRVPATYFMTHINAAVSEIYARLGLPMDPAFQAHLVEQQERQKHRDRGYSYEALKLEGFEEYDTFVGEIPEHYCKLE